MTRELFELLDKHESRVFPEGYFRGLPQRLRGLFEHDMELRNILADAASKVSKGATQRRKSKTGEENALEA
eukprot:816869-Prymnesium_polylepis.1